MSKVMVLVIGLAFALAKVGYLRKATLELAKRALYAQQHEMISLGKLSRALNGEKQSSWLDTKPHRRRKK